MSAKVWTTKPTAFDKRSDEEMALLEFSRTMVNFSAESKEWLRWRRSWDTAGLTAPNLHTTLPPGMSLYNFAQRTEPVALFSLPESDDDYTLNNEECAVDPTQFL